VDPDESARIQHYLRGLLGAPGLVVRGASAGKGAVLLGTEKLAEIVKDEEEGELSYAVSMGLARNPALARNAPLDAAERARLEKLLQTRLGAPGLNIRQRPRKTDSAEVFAGDEFIGVLSADERNAEIGYYLTLSILDIDLEGDA
jgi:Protein of unknown function (DUF3126)